MTPITHKAATTSAKAPRTRAKAEAAQPQAAEVEVPVEAPAKAPVSRTRATKAAGSRTSVGKPKSAPASRSSSVEDEPTVQELADSLLERRSIDAGSAGLAGKRFEFPGLQLTITDVLVRVELLDGRKWTNIVRPQQPWIAARLACWLVLISAVRWPTSRANSTCRCSWPASRRYPIRQASRC